MKMKKQLKVLILTDGGVTENDTFAQGIAESMAAEVHIENHQTNKLHGSKWKNIRRYFNYFIFPLRFIHRRKEYDYILGWQQFYANNLAFYCEMLGLRPRARIVSVNYTYKEKYGIMGKLYKWYMRTHTNSDHLLCIHLPSNMAAEVLHHSLGTSLSKMIVANFGVDDIYHRVKSQEFTFINEGGYVLSLGRSNRDFDFLVEVWKEPELQNETLVILSDTWQPILPLPVNIIHRTDVVGEEAQFYLVHCKVNVIPIDIPTVCSGDTVLLHGMQYECPTVVTAPSILAEMYIDHGINGLCLTKDVKKFAFELAALLHDESRMKSLGQAARQKFLSRYSRYAMGVVIGNKLKEFQ